METPFKSGLLAVLGLTLLAACTDPFSRGSGANADAVNSAQSTKNVTYSTVAPIIKTYCVSCHDEFSKYSGVAESAGDILNKVFKSHTMPPSGHAQPSAAELSTLQAWLNVGAPADPGEGAATPTPVPMPLPENVTYSQVSPILKTYCVACHAGLANYPAVASNAGAITAMVFKAHTMPPAARPQPSATELATLESWLNAGALPDASVTPTPTPVAGPASLPATWSYISANIINAKCIKCHSAASRHGSLASYNDLFAAGSPKVVADQPENSPFYEVLEDGAKVVMPPSMTGMSIDPAERTAIHDWIANGAKNDLLPQ